MSEKKTQPPSDLEEKLQKTEKEKEEYLNNWKRERADFVNYKKDEERRVGEIIKYSSEGMILEMVEVMDNFRNLIKHLPPELREKNKDWVEGLEKTEKDFESMLRGYGVEKISVEGQKFDPLMHDAVEMTSGGEKLEEVRAGYKLHDKIIRPARVKIIK